MIQENIPIPDVGYAGGRPKLYPFEQLRVGDSFFAAKRPCTTTYQQKTGWRFTTRRVVENGQPGFRVWRVEAGQR